ncbi:MAG: hypothetical protein LAQ69_17010 [Acidobacteriia bacterium]|nr:hypothetical protein [Terriglobia bacterium]
MINRLLTVAPLLTLWIAMAALAYIVVRELGFSRIRKYPLALLVLVLALLALPAGGVYKLSLPYQARILARMSRRQSPAILLPNGCSMFPSNNIWNARVQDLPLDPKSATYIEAMGPDLPLHPDFGVGGGMPFAIAGADQPLAEVSFADGSESDRGPYRIPDSAPVELDADAHVLVVDPSRCMLYELFGAARTGPQQWGAGSGAVFDLRSNLLRPSGWTSADAAGLPILPGLARADEVLSGEIRHALRFTTRRTRRAFVWPARHLASRDTNPDLPPMGQRFRLKSSVDVSQYSQQTQVILRALQAYGMFLSDNGGPWFLTGTTDSRWSSQIVSDLRGIHGSDFEAVDSSGLMVTADSAQARQ